MTYRDILVQIDDSPAAAPRALAAAALAARLGAPMTGVFLKSEFLQVYLAGEGFAYLPPLEIDALFKDHAQAIEKASESAREMFERAAREAGVESDWRVTEGDDNQAIVALARRFDLTVFPTSARASLGDHKISAAGLGLASGGPLLVVPDGDFSPQVGKRVLVAWKDSRESARALRDAWPLLAGADEVHVLVVSPHGEGGPDGLLQRSLERHGCKPNLIVDRSDDASAGEIIRRQIGELHADLAVMGLYGRPRLQEIVLGGVTRDLLRDPPVALLVSH